MSPLLYRVLALPLMIIFMALAPVSVSAQANDALLVKGVQVDVSADTALSARNKAFVEARRKAYEHVAAQHLSQADMATLVVPDDAVLASMVRDFEIENERMTSRRYVGTINVRFNPSVRRAFRTQSAAVADPGTDQVITGTGERSATTAYSGAYPNERDYIYSPARGNTATPASVQAVPLNAPATQTATRPVLVLPWYGARGRQTIWGQENPWRAAWESSAKMLQDPAMPILLPVGDVDDVRDYAPPQPLSQRGDIGALLKRYNASDAVLALAEPAEGGAVVVSLYRIEGTSPVAMGRFGVDAGAGRDSMKQAVERAIQSLRAMPQSQSQITQNTSLNPNAPYVPATPLAQPAAMQFTALARFSGLQQWVQMRNALSGTPGVQALDIQSISPAQAQLTFGFNGDSGALSAVLAQNGLQLVPLAAGNASVVPGAPAPAYQLTSTRSF